MEVEESDADISEIQSYCHPLFLVFSCIYYVSNLNPGTNNEEQYGEVLNECEHSKRQP